MLHNFFLENGARTQKLRVYQMTKNPVAREMLGYLFVRGGVHAPAYAKALESLTGVEMSKMLPIPKIANSTFPECKKFEQAGSHRQLYRFSPNDYKECWKEYSFTPGFAVRDAFANGACEAIYHPAAAFRIRT